ncbi:RHS repeat domain-containing protein [Rhodopirellula sp. JC639]|uniref:RHS repeat domain-containing protein n=1 Tax=Stieleria mannarensis TaxID=2755585 RepID=UPI001600B0C6|nr:RHS repeat-associated core domain-containing protein [Rhodopirellula sp. JC639]
MTAIPAFLRPGSDPLTSTWGVDHRSDSADADNDSTGDVFHLGDALVRRLPHDDGTTVSITIQNALLTVADSTSATAATTPTDKASYIDAPVVRDGPGGLRDYHRTQQYSITALTDSSGAIKERYAYDAYGNLSIFDGNGTARTSTAEGNRYMYTGREYDDVLDLYHYRARMYDSISGRFCSRDPIGYADGVNLLQFVSSMPCNAIDPLGYETGVAPGGPPKTPISFPHQGFEPKIQPKIPPTVTPVVKPVAETTCRLVVRRIPHVVAFGGGVHAGDCMARKFKHQVTWTRWFYYICSSNRGPLPMPDLGGPKVPPNKPGKKHGDDECMCCEAKSVDVGGHMREFTNCQIMKIVECNSEWDRTCVPDGFGDGSPVDRMPADYDHPNPDFPF